MRWEFRLPDLGEGIHEAEMVSWLVQPGDEVTEDQIVAEIETDKSIAEIPSPVNGKVVELLAEEGAVVQVGQPLLVFEVESVPAALGDTSDLGSGAQPQPQTPVQASPLVQPEPQPPPRQEGQSRAEVRGQAHYHVQAQDQVEAEVQALDEAQLQPEVQGQDQSEQNGADQGQGQRQVPDQAQVQDPEWPQGQTADPSQPQSTPMPQVQARPQSASQPQPQVGPQPAPQAQAEALPYVRRLARDLGIDIATVGGTGRNDRVTEPDVLRTATEAGRSPERVPLRGIRRATALNMARSFYTAPHAAVMEEIEVGELVGLREVLLPQAQARQAKLTYLPFIIMATVRALKKHPYLNASLDDERQEIILRYEYNIGIATDTPGGLLVPVIRGADALDLWGLAAEIERLAGAARRQRLEHRDMQNGTFTITNVGPLGGVWSVPIIRHPEVAILAVHRIQRRPVVRGERVEVGQMLNLVLTFDHRVVDGADALRFLKDLRLYLEHPALIFMPGA